MIELREMSLGDLVDVFDSRRIPLSAAQRADRKGVFPYYGAQGVIDHVDSYIFDGRYILVPEDGENLNSRKLPIAYFADGRFWVNNHAHIVRGRINIADDVYLKHAINSLDIRPYISGAAQPKLTQAALRRIVLYVPPIATQRVIGGILASYDDLIETNCRRVTLLENMARGLFEEWFVRFQFPGYRADARHNTPERLLPNGWQRVPLRDVAGVNSTSISPRSAPEKIGYIDIASVSPGQIDHVEWQAFSDAPGRARRRVVDGSIIWSNVRPNRRSFALVLNPEANTIASTGFSVLDAFSVSFAYLYCAVTTDSFVAYLTNHATGAAYPAVNSATFERAILTVPTSELLTRFSTIAEPAFRLANTLRVANHKLTAARDLLLPRLLSGRLTLRTAERQLADAA